MFFNSMFYYTLIVNNENSKAIMSMGRKLNSSKGASSINSALDFMGYLKCLFLSDGQEQDVVVGTIREKSSVLPAIGAV